MNTPEFQQLWKAVDDLNASAYEVPCQSWEEYQRRLGQYQGLREALNILTDLDNKSED